MSWGQSPAGRLLGRAAELGAIAAAVASARAGTGSTLLVEGTAGIGKTRLLTHAAEHAAGLGMTVLAARAAEFEGGYAWGVVRQLFEPELRRDGAQRLVSDAVALAAPALTHGASRDDQDPFAILHGLYWLTAGIAQRAPLLLAVDDLHWADQPSLRFTAYLARRLEGLPVLLVLTVREPRSVPAADRELTAGLAAEASVRVLRPAALGTAACAELVSRMLGGEPSLAFQDACRELTGGNPLLLQALLASLIAERVMGTDADVPHLRRLTPGVVSRSVLLQLGRMSAAALSAARAVAVLGTAATIARVGRLAGLDADACADAVAALMTERLIEGEQALRFVHPLVRSAVYQDLASPVRQRWHARAARMLDAEGATREEVTVHLLGAGPAGDAWVVDKLREAAADARGRGAADVAVLYLQRALAEPPAAGLRRDVLFELGKLETMQAPAEAVGHLSEALARTADWPRRGEITLALGEALALGGRFTDAVDLLARTVTEAREESCREPLEAALLNTARMDVGTRALTQSLLERVTARAARGDELHPQLHANLAIELAATGQYLERAVWNAREALRAMPRLMSVSTAALPETISVLLFADQDAEARAAAHSWLRLAQEHGSQPAAAVAAGITSLIALYGGEVSEAAAFGQQAIAGAPNIWISTITVSFVVRALIQRGEIEQARVLLADRSLTGDLAATWPHNLVRHARGCLHASAGDQASAVVDLLEAGKLAGEWGIPNPAIMPWRSDAALPLTALGDRQLAIQLCGEEIGLARQWGASRALGIALTTAGVVDGTSRGIELLTEAVTVLRSAPAPLELARALIDLGAALRRAGSRAAARGILREGLDLAHRQGGVRLAARARQELVVAGGKPRRDALRGRDSLTPGELRVAQLAAAGQTNRQIAQALFVTQRTVENHLTSTYAKLGISSRPSLPAALADRSPAAPGLAAPTRRARPAARCRHSLAPRACAQNRCTVSALAG
jgi:DNA-binding CsgD family transcriptional regulator